MSRASPLPLHNELIEWIIILNWLPFKLIYLLWLHVFRLIFGETPVNASMEPSKISNSLVKSVSTGEMCRLGAQQISQLKPRLDAKKIRFVAIGLEELGVEEFVKGGYFTGELYIDLKKETYKKLGFRRMNVFTVMGAVFGKKGREALSETKQQKIDGNMAGDGFQNGGNLVVDKGGKLLFAYRQESPAVHVDPNEILKVLGMESNVDASNNADTEQPAMECDDEACALPSSN